ncbi:MAG: 4Fe-4S dicluster domain-containing protein, partial [Myxococcota bacterium]
MFFGLFGKKKEDEEPANYSRRKFLRGGFIRDAVDRSQTRAAEALDAPEEPDESTPAQQETSDESSEAEPFDLIAMLAAADPSAKDRKSPPGYGRLENHPRRRGQIPVLRPPGAVAEHQFLELCTRCDACLDACPHGSITLAPHRFKDAAGTPMIDAFDAPCHMCEDMPCISACDTGALDPNLPRKIGIAHLQTYNCLAHNSTICTVCEERCPVEGAIELD